MLNDINLILFGLMALLSYLLVGEIRKLWMIAKYQLNVELSKGEEEWEKFVDLIASGPEDALHVGTIWFKILNQENGGREMNCKECMEIRSRRRNNSDLCQKCYERFLEEEKWRLLNLG